MLDLDKSKKYLLACSFGPDSMALFHMLKIEGYNFKVAHVNYGVRPEAKDETDSLNIYCAENDVEIDILFSKSQGIFSNFEAKARETRYKFFKKIYDEEGFDALLVAHHQDDVLETYFLQRQRGGFVEYFGIAPETTIFGMRVIRPLLKYSKEQLLSYDQINLIPFGIDSSNLSNDFSRNIVRHNIVEKMNEYDRNKTLEEIKVANEEIEELYGKLHNMDLDNVKNLLSLPDDAYQRALVIMARRVELDASISLKLSQEIKKILLSPKPNVSFKIHEGLIFNKEYDWCSFVEENKDFLYSYVIDKPKEFETEYFYLNFTLDSSNRNVKEEDYPITVRSPLANDKVRINGYEVELRRLFIDWKMPSSLRKKRPVITDKKGHIIYVPRYRKDFEIEQDSNFYAKI